MTVHKRKQRLILKVIGGLIAFTGISLSAAFAKKPPLHISDKIALISGKAIIDGKPADSVSFEMMAEYLYYSINRTLKTVKCDRYGNFTFKAFLKNDFELLDITLWGGRAGYLPKLYIAKDDSVHLSYDRKLDSTFVNFSGHGSEKYNCKYNIEKLLTQKELAKLNLIPTLKIDPSLRGVDLIVKAGERGKFLRNKADSVLFRYKSSLSEFYYEMIESEIASHRAEQQVNTYIMEFFFSEKDPNIKKMFYSEFPPVLNSKLDESIIDESLIKYFFTLSRSRLYLEKGNKQVSISEIYNRIKADYQGVIRQRVITFFLLSKPIAKPHASMEEFITCLRDALELVKSTEASTYLRQCLDATLKNPLKDFAMPDSTGKIRHINEFKGKVVLLDLWFTGCIPCMQLASNLDKNVVPFYRNKKSVAFITVNLDERKSIWLKSLTSGRYTNSDAINLYSDGLAFQHPFIKAYGVTACPVLILVDKDGNVVSPNLTRDANVIMNKINELLREK